MMRFVALSVKRALQQDLKCEVGGAAALEEIGRRMKVDVVPSREVGRADGVVPRPHERLRTPALDALQLSLDDFFYRSHLYLTLLVGTLPTSG
jgi:hypothetical protein